MPRLQDPQDPIWDSNNRIFYSKFGLAIPQDAPLLTTNERYPRVNNNSAHRAAFAILKSHEPSYLGEVFIRSFDASEHRHINRFPCFSKRTPFIGIVTGLYCQERLCESSPGGAHLDWQVRISTPTNPASDTLWWLSEAAAFRRPPLVLRNERLISRKVSPRSPRGTRVLERMAISWDGPPLLSFAGLDPEFVRHVRQRIDEFGRECLDQHTLNALRPTTPEPEVAVPRSSRAAIEREPRLSERAADIASSSTGTTTGRPVRFRRASEQPVEPSAIQELARVPGAAQSATPTSFDASTIRWTDISSTAPQSEAAITNSIHDEAHFVDPLPVPNAQQLAAYEQAVERASRIARGSYAYDTYFGSPTPEPTNNDPYQA